MKGKRSWKLTDAERHRAAEAYLAGASPVEVAAEFGVEPKNVRHLATYRYGPTASLMRRVNQIEDRGALRALMQATARRIEFLEKHGIGDP